MGEMGTGKTFLGATELADKRNQQNEAAEVAAAIEDDKAALKELEARLKTAETEDQRQNLQTEIDDLKRQIEFAEVVLGNRQKTVQKFDKVEGDRKKKGALPRKIPQA